MNNQPLGLAFAIRVVEETALWIAAGHEHHEDDWFKQHLVIVQEYAKSLLIKDLEEAHE